MAGRSADIQRLVNPHSFCVEQERQRRPNRLLIIAGLLQLASMAAPAARVRFYGVMPFYRLPNAGVALGILAALTIAMAFVAHRWWSAVPPALSGVILIVAYWRIVNAPSGYFFDSLVRRIVHPAWGFAPMILSVVLALAANAHGMYAMQSISTRNPSPGNAAA
jgi:hypothetical protein